MDVKELLDEKRIAYRNSAKDYIISCLNPEHEDRNPSMRIDKLTGVFHCFSCGFAGDIFNYYGVAKPNVVNIKVSQLLEKISKLIEKKLKIPLNAVYYNSDYRNISKDTYRHFSAFTVDKLLGIDMEGRIIFPIKDIQGRITNFHGRYLFSDLDPRYKSLPENTPIPLFPAVVEPIADSIILVEGFFDMLNLYDKGLRNVVCAFGTNIGSVKKKEKQKQNLERLLQYKYQGINKIYIMFDGDKAGRESAKNLKAYASPTFQTETIDLPDGMDPGKLTQEDVDKLRGILYGGSSTS
jgi:DNA primase